MPTLKPRVNVTLDPQTYGVIDRLAAIQGRSRGSVISDLLDSIAPVMARTVALLEAAAVAPQQVKDGLRSVVDGIHDELVAVSGRSTQQMDDLFQAFSGGSPDVSTPVSVTRGSGTDSTPPSAKAKTTRKRSKPGVSDA